MTINYTTLLGLTEPVTGTQSGTWGSDINTGLTDYVEAAIAGAQVISGSQTAVTLSVTTGSSSAPTTLSQAGSGATGSSQYQIIRCTGNPASTLVIDVPKQDKTYIVINATSTSQTVTLRGGPSTPTTGVNIVAGEKAVCAWNGSDFVKVGGAAGGSNTQVQYNNNGVFGGVSGATTNGTAITFSTTNLKLQGSSTGVSSFASANSSASDYTYTFPAANTTIPVATQTLTFSGPTAARTITLPDANFTAARTDAAQTFTGVQTFSSNPVLSGGTANGVLYLNGSNVATSGSALTFDGTTFQYTGAANFATSSGNVGIGTSSATYRLNVVGTNGGTTGLFQVGISAVTNGFSINTDASNNIVYSFLTKTGSTGIYQDASGNVGIGVTPSAWTSDYKIMQLGSTGSIGGHTSTSLPWALVNANYYINSAGSPLFIQAGYAPRYILRGDNGTHSWWTTNSGSAAGAVTFTQAMTLDASGNLGVGTTSPQSGGITVFAGTAAAATTPGVMTLGPNSTTVASGEVIGRVQFYSNDASGSSTGVVGKIDCIATSTFVGDCETALTFHTNDGAAGTVTERARITSGGDLQIANGNLVISTSGKGIDFSATSSGSGTMTSELLDDYEEGTFLPTLASGFSTAPTGYTLQQGRYTKIGRYVFFQINIDPDGAVANGNQVKIGGLPFTVGFYGTASVGYQESFNTNSGDIYLADSTSIDVYTNAGSGRGGTDAGVNINKRIILSGSYIV